MLRVARSALRMRLTESKVSETPVALSSAYRNCFEMVRGKSAMYILKKIRAYTEPWGDRYMTFSYEFG